MLRFVLGRAGSGKTETLRRALAQALAQGKGRLVMLVPEQFSFETEKAMLALCGPQGADRIQVYSFTRLAEAVFREEGGGAGRRLSDGGRRVLMASALAACEDQLELYRDAARNGRVNDLMLTAVNEMKMCGVTPERLSEAAEALGDRGLGKKLREIALLYGAFEALVSASYLDSRDDLTRLRDALETSEFFRGATVAVDSFDGFTVQELEVLGQILRKAESVTVALCTDGTPQGDTGLFALVERTRGRLTRLARERGVPVGPDQLLTGAPRFREENLKLWEGQLFSQGETLAAPDCRGVRVFSAKDVYEEAEFVAASVRRLTAERGWRYRDIAIVCRSPERYVGSLDVALKKRGIPCFVSQPDRVDAQPVTRFILGAFEAVASGLATEDLLEMLKTGLSGFTTQEISDLENYAFLWRITRGDWNQPFVRHPRGFGQEMTGEDRAALDRLEGLRQRLTQPLRRFAEGTKDASGAAISEAVFRLLEDFRLEETLPAFCAGLEAAQDGLGASLAAKQRRVWDSLMELLDQFHSILGERRIPRERYYRLLREVVAKEDVSEIPQTTDQVVFGTAGQVRQSAPKAVFLLGAAQGDFPLAPKSSGVFSDAERRELIAMDLPLGDPLEQKALEERYLAYAVACAPSELLTISWPRTAGGEEKEPGELVAAALAVFPTLEVLRDLPDEFYADTREAAFSRMAARYTENTSEAAALRALFTGREEYAGRLDALARTAGRRPAKIQDPALARRLFGENLFLSPTQIETYHSCAFKYFCRYGLRVQERRPAQVDALAYGTLVHYLFERVFPQGHAALAQITEEELLRWVRELIAQYAQENLGGLELLTGQDRYRLDRLARSACKLIRHVQEELAKSRFEPRYFELRLGEEPGCPPLRIEDGAGGVVTVGGTIDRADLCEIDGKEYVRVIDYKTGHKVFQLVDVLYGLNMQMLIYLAALVEDGHRFPAGVLYMPSAELEVSGGRGDSDERLRREADRKLRMSGLVLSDGEVLQAMEDGAKGRFIPASLNRDGSLGRGSSALDEAGMRQVLAYAKRLVATMGRALREGAVAARPALVNQNACRYCPYGGVCGEEYGERDITRDKATPWEAVSRMTEAMEEGGRGHG